MTVALNNSTKLLNVYVEIISNCSLKSAIGSLDTQ